MLVREELKLARLEMTSKGKQAALGTGMFGVSGVMAAYGMGCLLACAVIAISGAVAAWLAAPIVGAALLAAAGSAALLGKRRLARAAPPVPEEAVASVKADVDEIRDTPVSAEEIQREIEQTRQRLGETVDELAAKVDVKTRARATAAEARTRVQEMAADVSGRVRRSRSCSAAGPWRWPSAS